MYLPKFNLVYSSGLLSYRNFDNKIFAENVLLKHSDCLIDFQNEPLANWKLSFERKAFVPPGCKLPIDSFFITHPHDENIKIACFDFEKKIDNLTIVNGIIQEKIFFVHNSFNSTIVIEGTEEYFTSLELLEKNSLGEEILHTDLVPGDIFSFNGSTSDKNIYLGVLYVSKVSFKYRNSFIYKPKKVHLFIEYNNVDSNSFVYLSQKKFSKNSFKDIHISGHLDKFNDIDVPSIFNVFQISTNIDELLYFTGLKSFLTVNNLSFKSDLFLLSYNKNTYLDEDNLTIMLKNMMKEHYSKKEIYYTFEESNLKDNLYISSKKDYKEYISQNY